MIQRLFFDRIDAIAAGAAVGGQHNFTVLIGAHKTQAALAFVQLAETRAYVALHAPILKLVPVLGSYHIPQFFRFRHYIYATIS